MFLESILQIKCKAGSEGGSEGGSESSSKWSVVDFASQFRLTWAFLLCSALTVPQFRLTWVLRKSAGHAQPLSSTPPPTKTDQVLKPENNLKTEAG